LDDISLGIETLLTDSIKRAEQGAFELNSLNQQRREIEDEMRQQAMAYLESIDLDTEYEIPFGLSLFNEEWHQGVIGILASRIKDRYHRPVIAFAAADDEWVKGSARSIPGVHIRDLLDSIAAKHPELINKFGGHAMAAGLTLLKQDLDRFSDAFDAEVREHLEIDDIRGIIHSDGELPPQLMNIDTATLLRDAGPWGQNFPEPIFDGQFSLINWRIVGEKHLKLVVVAANGETIDAIAFNQGENSPTNGESLLEAAYRLDVNEYRGIRTVQLIIEHLEWLHA
jgi:single-stranded-DNA-specific exonuclease